MPYTRKQIEEFRDANPDLAPLPQMALDEGEGSAVWAHAEKMMAMYARPEMSANGHNAAGAGPKTPPPSVTRRSWPSGSRASSKGMR